MFMNSKNYITKQDLIYFVKDLKKNLDESFSKAGILQGLSLEIIKNLLGIEWIKRNIRLEQNRKINKLSASFFRQGKYENSDLDNFKNQDRIFSFGELLLNLQNIEGFKNRLKKAQKEDIEPFMAELQAVKPFLLNNINIKFIEPTGPKGENYDLEINYRNEKFCCEVKCKIEETLPTHNTLRYTLNEAKSQLPSKLQNLILIKIPEIWIKNPNINQIISKTLADFFRQSHRIISIIFFWEEWIKLKNGKSFRLLKFKEERNFKSKIINIWDETFFPKYSEIKSYNNWINLNDIIEFAY